MKGKEIAGTIKKIQGSVRLPGADEPKNAFQVFKQQFENFSEFLQHWQTFHHKKLYGVELTNV